MSATYGHPDLQLYAKAEACIGLMAKLGETCQLLVALTAQP